MTLDRDDLRFHETATMLAGKGLPRAREAAEAALFQAARFPERSRNAARTLEPGRGWNACSRATKVVGRAIGFPDRFAGSRGPQIDHDGTHHSLSGKGREARKAQAMLSIYDFS